MGGEATTRSASAEVTLDDALKSLGRLGTLTYQRRQMAKEGDVTTLLEQTVAGRQASEWVYWLSAIGFGTYALLGFLGGQLMWISASFAILSVVEVRRRRRLDHEVTTVVRQYAATLPTMQESKESLLLRELRSRFVLTYEQIQRLKRGQVTDVAKEALQKLKKHSRWQTALWASICLLQITVPPAERPAMGGSPFLANILLQYGHVVAMAVGLIYQWWMTRQRLHRLQQLLGEHPADAAAHAAGMELSSDRESPYRSPQFR